MAILYVHTSVGELRTYLKQAWVEREGETKLLLCYCFWVGRKRGKEGKGSRAPCAASEASPINPFFLPSLPDRSPTPARRQKCPIVFRFDSHHPISALRLDNTFPHSTSHPLPFHVLFPAHQRSGYLACPGLALSIHQALKNRDNNGLQQTFNRHCPQHHCK